MADMKNIQEERHLLAVMLGGGRRREWEREE